MKCQRSILSSGSSSDETILIKPVRKEANMTDIDATNMKKTQLKITL